jgi:ribosomal protein S11
MVNNFGNSFYQLNEFLKKIIFKKTYIKKIKDRVLFLNEVLKQNYKKLNSKAEMSNRINFLIGSIIEVNFSKANTFTQITNSSGTLKLSCSAGSLFYKGKNKKARTLVLKNLINVLIKKLSTLKNKAVVLHLKGTGFKKSWITKKLGKKTIIKIAAGFNLYSHNGCRKKKIGSKKI